MRRASIRRVVVIAAALAVGAMAPSPAAAVADERPMKALWTGNAHLSETDVPWIMRNDETGEGRATHLGRFTWASVESVDFLMFPEFVTVTGSFTMTAADGDQVFGEYSTVGINVDGNLLIHGNYEITGGTGRFAGANGSGALDAVAFLSPGLPFIGMMNGTIDY